jgi:hypothetical protein
MSPHLSNVDVLPLKRKELQEYILVSPVSTSRLSCTLTCILLVYILLACLSLVGNSPSCTSSKFTLCPVLKLKKFKILFSTYSPPLVACKDPFSRFYLTMDLGFWRMTIVRIEDNVLKIQMIWKDYLQTSFDKPFLYFWVICYLSFLLTIWILLWNLHMNFTLECSYI